MGPQPSDYLAPVFAYDHAGGGCSITGGYVVRDPALPELAGRYVYGGYCQGDLRSLSLASGRALGDAALGDPSNAAAPPLHVAQLDSFGEDALCRVYAVSQAGPVYRLQRLCRLPRRGARWVRRRSPTTNGPSSAA